MRVGKLIEGISGLIFGAVMLAAACLMGFYLYAFASMVGPKESEAARLESIFRKLVLGPEVVGVLVVCVLAAGGGWMMLSGLRAILLSRG